MGRTNRALNPRAVSSGAAGWTSIRGFGTGGAGTYSFVTTPTPPPNGIATVRRKTWTTASSAANNAGHQIYADASNYFSVTPGETVTVSAWVRHTSATNKSYVPRIQFWDRVPVSGAVAVGSLTAGTWVLGPGGQTTTWTWISQTIDVPAGALGMAVYMDFANVGDPGWAVGDIFDTTCLLIEGTATTNDYFDGTMPSTSSVRNEWAGVVNSSVSQQIETVSWWSGDPAKKQFNYWDVGAWQPFGPTGLTGPVGPTGSEGIRTSCGGCSFVGGQDAQPDSVMWDVTRFVADGTYAADPSPCLQMFDTSTLQVVRGGTLVIGANINTFGKGITGGSSITLDFVSGSRGTYARAPIPRGSDRGTASSIVQLSAGDQLKFAIWLVTGSATKYDLTVTAAVLP
jgi:hypothetical protein